MKKAFQEVELNIVHYETEDVMVSSNDGSGDPIETPDVEL